MLDNEPGILVGGSEHDFYDFPYIGNNHPSWLIFFRGVETTTQGYQLSISIGLHAPQNAAKKNNFRRPMNHHNPITRILNTPIVWFLKYVDMSLLNHGFVWVCLIRGWDFDCSNTTQKRTAPPERIFLFMGTLLRNSWD